MTTRTQLLNVARRYVGIQESPRGSNKQRFAKVAGHANGQPWCQTMCVADVVEAPGTLLEHMPDGWRETAYTPTAESAYKRAGRLHSTPKVGDQGFLYFPSMGRVAHTFWVLDVNDATRTIVTLEGNTNTDGSRDGYKVAIRVRPYGAKRSVAYVRSFGRPPYTAAVVGVTQSWKQRKKGRPSAKEVTQVKAIQRALAKAGVYHGRIDGGFGPATAAAVWAFKKPLVRSGKVAPNKTVGAGTVKALGAKDRRVRWAG